jgi:hypothetical protein
MEQGPWGTNSSLSSNLVTGGIYELRSGAQILSCECVSWRCVLPQTLARRHSTFWRCQGTDSRANRWLDWPTFWILCLLNVRGRTWPTTTARLSDWLAGWQHSGSDVSKLPRSVLAGQISISSLSLLIALKFSQRTLFRMLDILCGCTV